MEQSARRHTAERQTLWILLAVCVWMTLWIGWRFLADPARYVETSLGVGESLAAAPSWIWLLALAIVALYATYTLWVVPDVRRYVLRFNALGVVAIWAAVVSGIIEEVLFRQRLMDWLDGQGHSRPAQVLGSGFVFGTAHAFWIVMLRDWRIVIPIVASTTALGCALALLYLVANRSTLPAIAAHSLINLIIEPGLITSACLAGLRARERECRS